MRKNIQSTAVFVLAIVGSLVLLNILAVRVFKRIDFTRDRIFTLSKASRDTMSSLEEPVTITAYFTEKLPPPFAGNARYLRDLLEEYRAASRGKVSFEFIDPATQETAKDKEKKREVKQDIFGRPFHEETSVEKELSAAGVQPVQIRVVEADQLQTKRAYMALVIRHQEKKEVIPVVQDLHTIEYDITSLIRKLTRPKTPVIAISQGHDEPRVEEKLNRLQTLLSQLYSVRPVDLTNKKKIDDDVDALLVMGPKRAFTADEQKAVDQFLMQGKSVAFFLDKIHVDLKTFQPTDAESGLEPLLETYGVKAGDQLVADVQSAQLSVQERRGFMVVSMPVLYPFIPLLKRLEGDSPITKGLTGISYPFVTSVTALGGEGRQIAVLAKSSPKSWLEPKPFNIDPRREWRSETITPNGPYDLMVQVTGRFPSHFASEVQPNASSAPGSVTLAESKGDSRIIVAGGASLLTDDFMSASNQALALNIADWLLLDQALLTMRTRGMTEAPLQTDLSDATRNAAKLGNVLGLPLLLALYGVVRWRMREARRNTVTV
jgi:gliding-associated putative ABC transporter substrate-binding component GldG